MSQIQHILLCSLFTQKTVFSPERERERERERETEIISAEKEGGEAGNSWQPTLNKTRIRNFMTFKSKTTHATPKMQFKKWRLLLM